MVAALSPADINYDETLSTLRCVLEQGGLRPLPGSGRAWIPDRGRSTALGEVISSGAP